ncbi:helix-turn-helix domain-containing protein [Pyramidobacter sp. YE332]|uniref:helix-turn-helix domain-containing protein n=1 Tax=Pyramidobacter sp. YE332 TaxID=3068894 RepID=UPI00294B259A|nr:helix-turn-helix domain-containing protein [Pyramidobacter sp. YE332]WOL38877.1 helix-turn-helix domain-containing protein [Pyramidobacter sp. YE332]
MSAQESINKAAARTQRALVLRHLKSGRTLTQDEAQALYGVRRLAARISELRNDFGFPIRTEMVDVGGVSGLARYSLEQTPEDIKRKRAVLQSLLRGDAVEAVPGVSPDELARIMGYLRADGWPVLAIEGKYILIGAGKGAASDA